jgi:hypothetical protein
MFMAFRHWGSLEAAVKHVGLGREEMGSVVASKALGRGYRTVSSVGSLGLLMLFLDRVSIG